MKKTIWYNMQIREEEGNYFSIHILNDTDLQLLLTFQIVLEFKTFYL